MTYGRRLTIAACLAALIHGAAVVSLGHIPQWRTAPQEAVPEPIVLNLRPHSEPARRLIDQDSSSEEPPDPTDLISEMNAKARDMTDGGADGAAPRVAHVGEFDQAPRPAPEPIRPQTGPPPERERKPEATQETEPVPSTKERLPATRPQAPKDSEEPRESEPKRFEVARAQPPSPEAGAPDTPPSDPRGRVEGNAMRKGFLAFEAMADEVAPYLRDVRRRVETRWRAALHLRYSGTTTTQAVLDCAIAPDGTLAYVRIVDPGGSPSYAALCREAIERAGPFPPFPFQVPDMYREKNLEIRWTFSFL